MHFVTRVMPIIDIDGNSHGAEWKSSCNYSANLIKLKIAPSVIYGPEMYTHMHTFADKVIIRNQAHAGLRLACAWFNKVKDFV